MTYFMLLLLRPCTKWRVRKKYSWNSEVETTWIILIGWHHKTSTMYTYVNAMTWCAALTITPQHLRRKGCQNEIFLGKPTASFLSLEKGSNFYFCLISSQIMVSLGSTSLFRRPWVCWVMDIIYLANSENTHYINLFNLTIALVYLIEKSPQLEKLKPCLTTGAPAAKWLSRLAPVRHSIVAGP